MVFAVHGLVPSHKSLLCMSWVEVDCDMHAGRRAIAHLDPELWKSMATGSVARFSLCGNPGVVKESESPVLCLTV